MCFTSPRISHCVLAKQTPNFNPEKIKTNFAHSLETLDIFAIYKDPVSWTRHNKTQPNRFISSKSSEFRDKGSDKHTFLVYVFSPLSLNWKNVLALQI